MTSLGVALDVLVGSVIAMFIVYPNATIGGPLVVGLVNGAYAYLVLKVSTEALPLLRKQ